MLTAAGRDQDADALGGVLSESISQIDLEIATLRALITDLRPAALDEIGIDAAIRSLADRASRAGLDVDVDVDLAYEQGRHAQRLAAELEAAIYRIVQEALTNARKHGGAKRAAVEVVEQETTVRVTIHDDGNGSDPTTSTDGYGLLGMRERADLLNGAIGITSSPGEGTTITATLPAARRPQAENYAATQDRHCRPAGNRQRDAAGQTRGQRWRA